MHIARLALVQFGLDFVWWIVTPQNPLKSSSGMATYEERLGLVRGMTQRHPRMMAATLEDDLRTRYTYETADALEKRFPHTEFLWICGMDNARIFHRWDRWRELVRKMPVAFIARPPAGSLVQACPLRMMPERYHRHSAQGRKTALSPPKITWLRGTKMVDISSTDIRNFQSKSKGS